MSQIEYTNWEPTNDFIMLIPIELNPITPGGIHLPDSVYKKVFRGFVIKKGPNTTDRIQLGHEVFFPQNVEYDVNISESEEKRVYLVREQDIIMSRPPA